MKHGKQYTESAKLIDKTKLYEAGEAVETVLAAAMERKVRLSPAERRVRERKVLVAAMERTVLVVDAEQTVPLLGLEREVRLAPAERKAQEQTVLVVDEAEQKDSDFVRRQNDHRARVKELHQEIEAVGN